MSALRQLRRLWDHGRWADDQLQQALRTAGAPAAPLREYSHVVGAEEVWLARIERRAPRAAVWPECSMDEGAALSLSVQEGFTRYLATLEESSLEAVLEYRNSRGAAFTGTIGDILLHVVLHGQYHRGKINLLLREGGANPAPVDFIAWVRGVPAATRRGALHQVPVEGGRPGPR